MVIWLCPSVEVRSSPLVCKKGRLARRPNAVHVTTSTLAASQTTSTLQHFNTPTLLYNDGNLINPLRLQLSCLLATAKIIEVVFFNQDEIGDVFEVFEFHDTFLVGDAFSDGILFFVVVFFILEQSYRGAFDGVSQLIPHGDV